MKRLTNTGLCICAMAVLCFAGRAWGSTPLPYAEGFEGGSWSPADPWSASGGSIDDTTADKYFGDRGCMVSNGTLTLTVTPATYSNVWLQLWTKPVAGASDPSVSAVSGAFYVNTSGKVRAYVHEPVGGTNGWVDVGTVPSAAWLGFILNIDYAHTNWNLYYQAAGGSVAQRLNTTELYFPSSGASQRMYSVEIESGSKAYIDGVGVSRSGRPVTTVAAAEDYVVAHLFPAGPTDERYNVPVYADSYTAAGGSNLTGTVGLDLRGGLRNNDDIVFYETVSHWSGYELVSGNWADSDEYPPTTPYTAKKILPTDYFRLVRDALSAASWGFIAYDDIITVDGVKDTGAPAYPTAITLYGTTGGHSGWTGLNWPRAEGLNSSTFPIQMPGADLEIGDRLYKADPSDPSRYKEYWWNGSDWQFGSTVSGDTVPGAANLWIRRGVVDGTAPHDEVSFTL